MGKSIKHTDEHKKIYNRDVSDVEEMMHSSPVYPVRVLPVDDTVDGTVVKGNFYDRMLAKTGRGGFSTPEARDRAHDISAEQGKTSRINKEIAEIDAKIKYYTDKIADESKKIDRSIDDNTSYEDMASRRIASSNSIIKKLILAMHGKLSELNTKRLGLYRELNSEVEASNNNSVETAEFIKGFMSRSASRLEMIRLVKITKYMYKDILNKIEDSLNASIKKSEELLSSDTIDAAAVDREYRAATDRLDTYYTNNTAADVVMMYLKDIAVDYYKECDYEYNYLLGEDLDLSINDKQAALIKLANDSNDYALKNIAGEFGKEQAVFLSLLASKKAEAKSIVPAISVKELQTIKGKLSAGIEKAVTSNEDTKEYAEDGSTYDSEEQLDNTLGYYGITCYVKDSGTARKYTWGNSGWRKVAGSDDTYVETDVNDVIKGSANCILYVLNSKADQDAQAIKDLESAASDKHVIYPNESQVKKLKVDVADVAVAKKLSSIGISAVGLYAMSKLSGYRPLKLAVGEKGSFQAAINENFLSYI
jgi:hypothetical protein